MYKDGVPAFTVYLASGIRVPILSANYYNYSQNPKVSASSGGLAALQQKFDKDAVQYNMLYFSGTTTNAERALWDSLWKDTVPNMSFSQVVDVWQGMTLLNVGAGYSAKDAMTTTAVVSSYAGVNTGTVMQEVARMLAPGFSIINGELVENHAYYRVAGAAIEAYNSWAIDMPNWDGPYPVGDVGYLLGLGISSAIDYGPELVQLASKAMDDLGQWINKQFGGGASNGNPQFDPNNLPNLQRIADNYLKKNGIDAHELKQDYLGEKATIKNYDLYMDKNTKQYILSRKQQTKS